MYKRQDFYPEPPVFEFETDGEKIKSVSFKYSGNWHEIMKNEGYDYLAIHSLLGARINCCLLYTSGFKGYSR